MRIFVTSFVVLTALSGVARAGEESMLAAMRREVFAPLDLSTDQKAQLKALYQQSKTEGQGLRVQVRDAGLALTAGMTGAANDAQLVALHQRYDAARTALGDFRFQGLLKVRQMLTPEQRGHFDDLYIAFVQNHRGHHTP